MDPDNKQPSVLPGYTARSFEISPLVSLLFFFYIDEGIQCRAIGTFLWSSGEESRDSFDPLFFVAMASLSASSLREPVSGNPPIGRIAGFPGVIRSPRRPRVAFHGVTYRGFGVGVEGGRYGVMRAVTSSNWADPAGVGVHTFRVPLLSGSEVAEKLREFQEKRTGEQNYMAMYSSIFGGITTDPAVMVIHMDDHLVHRGHGVFDTAAIMDGYLYELDQHLDRFLRSASMAKIRLPFQRSTMRGILIQTVSASRCRQGSLRYWLSPGPGDFLLSPSGCPNPALYAIVIEGQALPDRKGVKVITSSVPMKSPEFSVMKSVNYLPNALSKMEAEENGAFAAIWLDDEGFVAEGPNMNVAFVTSDRELVMPHFDKILSGCTAKRVLVLAEQLVADGRLRGIRLGSVSVQEGKMADEMMLIGSGVIMKPVLQWDDQVIGAGKEGPVARALFDLILEDMKSGPPVVRIPVPY